MEVFPKFDEPDDQGIVHAEDDVFLIHVLLDRRVFLSLIRIYFLVPECFFVKR